MERISSQFDRQIRSVQTICQRINNNKQKSMFVQASGSLHESAAELFQFGQDGNLLGSFQPAINSRISAKEQSETAQLLFNRQERFQQPPPVNQPRAQEPVVITGNYLFEQQFRRMKMPVETGLSRSARNKLKKMKISKTSQCCSICQQSYQKDQIILQLPCKHIFHRANCINEWFKCSVLCPICKMNIEEHFRNNPTEPNQQL